MRTSGTARRRGLACGLLVVLLLGVVACGGGSSSGDGGGEDGLRSVRLGVVTSGSAVPMLVAESEGIFERFGLDVELVEFGSGGELVQNVIAGGLAYGTFSVVNVLDFVARGEDVNALVLIQDRPIQVMVARKALDLRPGDWEALRGLRIGITSPGSASDTLARLLLEKHGIDPETEVTMVAVGNLDGQRAALEAGEIDVVVSFDPGSSQFTMPSQLDIATEFLDMRADDAPEPLPNLLQSAVAAKTSTIDDDPEVARSLVSALSCAQKALQADHSLIRAAFEQIFPGLDPEVYDNLVEGEGVVFEASITPEQIDVVSETYVDFGTLSRPVSYEEAVAVEFSDAWACDEG